MEKHLFKYSQLAQDNPADRTLLLFETLHRGAEVLSEVIHRISGYEIGYWELVELTTKLIEDHHRKMVRIPTEENEAVAMAVLGMDWLEKNAPHRLKKLPESA